MRREPLHPGAQQTFDDVDVFRFTAFFADQPDPTPATGHTPRDMRTRCAKNTGLAAMPLDTFDRNQLWCPLVRSAQIC